MNNRLYLLVRRTPKGGVFAHRTPFGSVQEAARVTGLVLADNTGIEKAAAQEFSARLASQPLGTIFGNDSGYDFRILTADFTADNVMIIPGLRVLTNDMTVGCVVPEQFMRTAPFAPGGQHFDGWYSVRINGDFRETDYNGERLTTDFARFGRTDVPRETSAPVRGGR